MHLLDEFKLQAVCNGRPLAHSLDELGEPFRMPQSLHGPLKHDWPSTVVLLLGHERKSHFTYLLRPSARGIRSSVDTSGNLF